MKETDMKSYENRRIELDNPLPNLEEGKKCRMVNYFEPAWEMRN